MCNGCNDFPAGCGSSLCLNGKEAFYNVKLSEETRLGTIILGTECGDLHEANDLYYICKHGTYEVVAIHTKEFYNKIIE